MMAMTVKQFDERKTVLACVEKSSNNPVAKREKECRQNAATVLTVYSQLAVGQYLNSAIRGAQTCNSTCLENLCGAGGS